jgi:hypothetical protein
MNISFTHDVTLSRESDWRSSSLPEANGVNLIYSASHRVALTVTLNTRHGSAAGGTSIFESLTLGFSSSRSIILSFTLRSQLETDCSSIAMV